MRQGAQKVDATKVGPVDLAKVVLRVHGLPQHESGEALFSRCPDDEVGVGLVLRVQVSGDVRVGKGIGQFFQGASLSRRFAHHGAHGLGDLVSSAVADGDVDRHPHRAFRARHRRPKVCRDAFGQQGEVPDEGELPAFLVGQERDGLADDAQQLAQLGGVAREIVGRQKP